MAFGIKARAVKPGKGREAEDSSQRDEKEQVSLTLRCNEAYNQIKAFNNSWLSL